MNHISIKNDSAFGPSGYNFPGTGTLEDPYMITGFNITDSSEILIEVDSTSVNYIIRDNYLNGINGNYPVTRFYNTTNGTIEGNIIINGYKGIFCYLNVFNVSIVDNYVNNNSLVGMQISASPDNNITDNYINGSVYGFLMNGSNFNLVSENIISNHTYGLYVSWSDNNSFTRNQICNNSQFGCILDFGADNNTVSGNDIYNNTYLGIHMYGYNNSVNRNNFIDNYQSGISKSQAQDNGSDNVFILNYWHDWTSPDSDDNGYVDNPYMINGTPGNLDSYPLRYSFKGYIPHLPISITNIIDFSTTYNFPGSGTINNPYLIEGYNFTDGTTDLVYIWSTDAFFIIRNCLMNGVIGTNYGIILEDVENGLMYENTIHSTTYGIRVGSSSKNNTLTNNHIYNNTFGGIILAGTTNNTVYKNTIDNSTVYSVRVLGSDVNTILCNNIRNSST
ncbi:MAG: right-handed parallel beta-helix repeat-containing protein [Candidatus Hodarchaeales archaeon]|jgi:parallel beta-helix repeat protein